MMLLPPFINLHTHIPSIATADTIALSSFMVGELTMEAQAELISVGIHPYQLLRQQKEDLFLLLETNHQHPRIWAMGETGLDRSIAVDLEIQQEVFVQQSLMAEKLQLPLVIHAVRSFDLMMQAHKMIQPSVPWIIHGFAAAMSTARPLLDKGFYFSIGVALFDKRRPIAQSLKELPLEKLFFETDTATLSIEAVYAEAAKILNMEVDVLRRQIFANFAACFKNSLNGTGLEGPHATFNR